MYKLRLNVNSEAHNVNYWRALYITQGDMFTTVNYCALMYEIGAQLFSVGLKTIRLQMNIITIAFKAFPFSLK